MQEKTPKEPTAAEAATPAEIAQLAGLAASMRALLMLCAPMFPPGSEGERIMQAVAQSQPLIAKCASAGKDTAK